MLTSIGSFIQKNSNWKNLFILLVIVIIIAVITTLFVRKQRLPIAIPVNARAGDLNFEPCDYKTKIATYKADCGTLIVPENRLNPTSRLIALPVKRVHAESDSPLDPIFYLGGGPGMSNMKFARSEERRVGKECRL